MKKKSANTTVRKKARPRRAPFPVVGIGASAGGLDAFRELLHALPLKTGMAFVLVQHLDPAHKSNLAPLLARATRMPVTEAQDDEVVKADRVYVIPPNADLTLADGVLKLHPRSESQGRHMAIDSFFQSLAETHASHTIGVLLSGTASDGTLGLKAIKAAGGIAFAQDEESAAFPDMPRNAVAAGVVDFVLPPKEIAKQLVRLGRHLSVNARRLNGKKRSEGSDEAELGLILASLRESTGVDFVHYKSTTLERRIQRRMLLHKLDTLADYRKFLEATPDEPDALYQDLLINVTGFFRDPDAFQTLKRRILPKIIKNHTAGEPLRVWVVGCASGEEAYSIAICWLEFLRAKSLRTPLQIFATDLDETAIMQARSGIYSKSALQNVSAERLQRFFAPVGDKYQVSPELREKCTFALHDVTVDPPFSNLDLISCRNVLIYMRPVLQKRTIATFHYALKSNGFLMLGTSEAIDGSAELFGSINKPNRIYARKGRATRVPLDRAPGGSRKPAQEKPRDDLPDGLDGAQGEADRILLAQHVPPSVIVDDTLEILQFRGSTGPYLEPAAGKASFNLLNMARPGLAMELRAAIRQARKQGLPARREGVLFRTDSATGQVDLEVVPLKGRAGLAPASPSEAYFLVLFEPARVVPPAIERGGTAVRAKSADAQRVRSHELQIKRLELELAATRGEMQSVVEKAEATNEELRAANEEVLSSNEELQTLNEELESSKEELQSTNEELTTLNQELQTRNDLLKEARDYAEAIVGTVREPLLILGGDLSVRSANASFYDVFKISPEETVGAYVYDLGEGQWNLPRLRTLLNEVLPKNHAMQDFEVDATFSSIGHKAMLLNARRIHATANQEDLILLALEDITERKELEQRRDEFIARTAHELKTPVTTLQGYTDMLMQRLDHGDDKAQSYAGKLNAQVRRLTILINDLLDVSRLQAGKLDLQREEFGISELAKEVVEDVQAASPTRRVVFEGATRKKVWADRQRINQVLTNLLTNALKFSPVDAPILVRTAATRSGVSVSVQDSGIGISKQDQAKLFGRFFQAGDPSQRVLGGMGLGLYISAEIVERHHGKIWVESQQGKGSTFTFRLPFK